MRFSSSISLLSVTAAVMSMFVVTVVVIVLVSIAVTAVFLVSNHVRLFVHIYILHSIIVLKCSIAMLIRIHASADSDRCAAHTAYLVRHAFYVTL
jgi:hypothetical protein